jgi:transcriptional activator of cad operon
VTLPPRVSSRSRWLVLAVATALAVALAGTAFVLAKRFGRAAPATVAATRDARSVVVLPFLDLTDAMGEEIFADGMTEELIDKLAKIPGLRVPPPTAAFWFKDKNLTIPEIARELNVAYVLDGSVRKSGTTLRVAARLVRASDGFVVWSETYDRPADDKLRIQDDIASEVGKAIGDAIARGAPENAVTPAGTGL